MRGVWPHQDLWTGLLLTFHGCLRAQWKACLCLEVLPEGLMAMTRELKGRQPFPDFAWLSRRFLGVPAGDWASLLSVPMETFLDQPQPHSPAPSSLASPNHSKPTQSLPFLGHLPETCLLVMWLWGLEGSRGLGVPGTKPQPSSPLCPIPGSRRVKLPELGHGGSQEHLLGGNLEGCPVEGPSPWKSSAEWGEVILRAGSQMLTLSRSACFESQTPEPNLQILFQGGSWEAPKSPV